MENIALFALEEWDLVWEHNLLNQIIVFVAMMYVWHIAELVIKGLRKYLFITFNIKKMYICCPWLLGASHEIWNALSICSYMNRLYLGLKNGVASQGRVQEKLEKVSYVLNKNQQLCFITPLLEPTYVSSHGCVVGLPIMEALVSLIDWNAG